MNWSFENLWNEVAKSDNRPPAARDYVYASEIMYPMIDRWLKMRGEPYTNPPNMRSLRKFWTGKVWEYVVKQVLVTLNLHIAEEITFNSVPYEGCLPVHGRVDFIAGSQGAVCDFEQAKQKLPDFLHPIAKVMIERLSGIELDKKILEIKSLSMFAFEYLERRVAPMDTHHAQAFYYQKAAKLPAEIIYISKDTSLMKEFQVQGTIEPMVKKDLAMITYYYTKEQRPPIEPLIGFEEAVGQFKKNLGVEYSPYLSLIYGFESPDEYRRAVEPQVKRYNTTIKRYAAAELGKTTPTGRPIKITDSNKEVREEIIKYGYDWKVILESAMAAGGDDNEDE